MSLLLAMKIKDMVDEACLNIRRNRLTDLGLHLNQRKFVDRRHLGNTIGERTG